MVMMRVTIEGLAPSTAGMAIGRIRHHVGSDLIGGLLGGGRNHRKGGGSLWRKLVGEGFPGGAVLSLAPSSSSLCSLAAMS